VKPAQSGAFGSSEHSHINEGRRAIIGNVKPAQSGALGSSEHSDGRGE
jgi:hypothetical protein